MLIPEIHSRCREHYLSLLCIFKLYMYSSFSMYLPRNSWFSVSLKFQTKKSSFDVRISLCKYCKYFKNVPKFFAQIAVELNRMTDIIHQFFKTIGISKWQNNCFLSKYCKIIFIHDTDGL